MKGRTGGTPELLPPPPALYARLLEEALHEDLGTGGDVTSDAVVPAGARCRARIIARQDGRVAGGGIACEVFQRLDGTLRCEIVARDGADIAVGEIVLALAGRARPILAGERVALNLLAHLSGIATLTRSYVRAVEGAGVRITDTRKTAPGLRALEKYAVRCGGGSNHRFSLDGAVLIKDNHLALAGSLAAAVERARRSAGHAVKIEVEVETLGELEEALAVGADAVLLDNMDPATLRQAVELVRGRVITEASGGVTLDNVQAVAGSGVDFISVGALTHSAPAMDLSLEIEPSD